MTLRNDVAPFGGKPPRLYYRMLAGERRAWSDSARAPRAMILAELQKHGLTMWLVRERGRADDYRYGLVAPLEKAMQLGHLPPAYYADGTRFPKSEDHQSTRWGA